MGPNIRPQQVQTDKANREILDQKDFQKKQKQISTFGIFSEQKSVEKNGKKRAQTKRNFMADQMVLSCMALETTLVYPCQRQSLY